MASFLRDDHHGKTASGDALAVALDNGGCVAERYLADMQPLLELLALALAGMLANLAAPVSVQGTFLGEDEPALGREVIKPAHGAVD